MKVDAELIQSLVAIPRTGIFVPTVGQRGEEIITAALVSWLRREQKRFLAANGGYPYDMTVATEMVADSLERGE